MGFALLCLLNLLFGRVWVVSEGERILVHERVFKCERLEMLEC